MKKFLFCSVVALLLSSCATGEKVRMRIREDMTKSEVISILGNPDGFKRIDEYEALTYTNRLMSGWSWDKTDYTVILKSGHVVQYGTGEVRQEGPNTLILFTP